MRILGSPTSVAAEESRAQRSYNRKASVSRQTSSGDLSYNRGTQETVAAKRELFVRSGSAWRNVSAKPSSKGDAVEEAQDSRKREGGEQHQDGVYGVAEAERGVGQVIDQREKQHE